MRRLDGALGNLIQREVSLPVAEGWDEMSFKVPSHSNRAVVL